MQRNHRAWKMGEAAIFALVLWLISVPPGRAQDLLDSAGGARLTNVESQYNSTSWAARNLTDDDDTSRWLSSQTTNDLTYQFDAAANAACMAGFTLRNYGSTRSIRTFSLLTSMDTELSDDTGALGWVPIVADPAPAGLINHLHWSQGGRLTSVNSEYNTTSYAGRHLNDGSRRSHWLSAKNGNTLEYAFDTDWDGTTGDEINLDEIRLHNYGNSRSVSQFQIHVTQDGASWTPLTVPGTAAGDPDFNFLLEAEGALLTRIDTQYNATSYAGRHLHDGDNNSRWLSGRSNNELDFVFDTDLDGTTGIDGDLDDLFDMERIHVRNYGNTRSVRLFQVEVKTQTSTGWSKLEVPGSRSGEPDFNFLLEAEGARLTRVDAQYNTTSYAGRHLHDGDINSRWLSGRSNNELDFDFDVNGDGVTGLGGDKSDRFRLEEFKLFNYGSTRSVRLFQIEVKARNSDWTPLEVPGSGAGEAGFNFALAHEGGSLTRVDAQYNTTSYAGSNMHDGDLGTRWLSGKPDNELDFKFDTDGDGDADDAINLDTVRLYNYGNSRSIQTFEVEVQIRSRGWSPVTAPGGGTVFTAAQAAGPQDFSVGPLSRVTAVRLRTLTNYGDTYTGAKELELLGDSVRASHTFTAQQSSSGESFVLDPPDRVQNVTAVRFRTIQNYGDTYTGARELQILGRSIGPSHTFEAAQASTGEDFVLDAADRPSDVTAVRFRSVANYGDTYTGMKELQVFGPATRPSYTFEAGQTVGPHVYTLEPDDRVDNVVGVRFLSLNNHGDSYIGAKELELLGDPVGPGYIFSANQAEALQSFSFDSTSARLLRLRVLDNFGDSYVGAREIEVVPGSSCSGATDRFLIRHDGEAVQCGSESIAVSAIDDTGSLLTSYAETIVLTTQAGAGGWSSLPGNDGVFSDANAGDGLATYTFAASDQGTASFSLTNVSAPASIDVDVYQSGNAGVRDDDSEGNLDFVPSAFTITASPLPNPPPSTLNDPIGPRTAGAPFAMHLAAYGTSPTHPECGIIESYDGPQSIRFWIEHNDPTTGPRVPTVDLEPIASNEASASDQVVTFSQGQGAVTVKYKDTGRLTIHAKGVDETSEIRGSSGAFVSRPADLVISDVRNASDEPNPEIQTPTGVPFARAGEPFAVTVEARDADGDLTPSFGNESLPESVQIVSAALVAPAGGRNGSLDDGAIANADAFALTSPGGTFVGTTFSFDEVGAIQLRASVLDGDFLGSGNVTGSLSDVVGRFAPSRFEVTSNLPRFATTCALGAFSWLGQPFGYVSGEEAVLTVTALNGAGGTTANYAGDWWLLTNGSLANRTYSVGSASLDQTGLPAAAVDPAIVSNGDGSGTLRFSAGSGLELSRSIPVAPFDAEIQLSIDVLDVDGTAYPSNPVVVGGTGAGAGIGFDVSKRFQFGRLRFDNAHGSELTPLAMNLRAQRFDGSVFVDDDNDSCSSITEASLQLTPSPAGLSTTPTISNVPLLSGNSGLVLSAPGADGSVDIVVDLGPTGANLPWLRFDWPDDGDLNGVLDDDPRARATFGIWGGRQPVIYMRENY